MSTRFTEGGAAGVATASTLAPGIIEIATNAEAQTGTSTDRAVTPHQLANFAGGITGALVYRGALDASSPPANIANASKGDFYLVTSTGVAFAGVNVNSGDHIVFKQDADGVAVVAADFDVVDNSESTDILRDGDLGSTVQAHGVILDNLSGLVLTNGDLIKATSSTLFAAVPSSDFQEASATLTGLSGLAAPGADSVVQFTTLGTINLVDKSTLVSPTASTITAGIVELATDAEAAAASATDKVLTPANIGSIGTSDLNNDAGFITSVATANTTTVGIVELADNTEAAAAAAADRALTPANIGSIGTSDLNNDAGFITDITSESLVDLSDVNYTAGAGIDGYVLTYVHGNTRWEAQAASGGRSFSTALVIAADTTLAANSFYQTNTSGLTLTVPASSGLSDGDEIVIFLGGTVASPLSVDLEVTQNVSAGIQRYGEDSFVIIKSNGGTTTLSNIVSSIITMVYDSNGDRFLVHLNGSAAAMDVSDFLSATGADTLGGNLDVGSSSIVSSSNADIAISPNGTGQILLDGDGTAGNGGVSIENGLIDIKNSGSGPSELRLYCESSNAHYVGIKSAPHGVGSANYSLSLPEALPGSVQYLKTDTSGNLSWDTPAAGGGSFPLITSITGAFTVGGTGDTTNPVAIGASELERIYLVNTNNAAITVTLPDASTVNAGFKLQIKRMGSHNITLDPSTGTIDGVANQVLSVQYASLTLVSDGSNTDWHII